MKHNRSSLVGWQRIEGFAKSLEPQTLIHGVGVVPGLEQR
jgi:hypothetical protein